MPVISRTEGSRQLSTACRMASPRLGSMRYGQPCPATWPAISRQMETVSSSPESSSVRTTRSDQRPEISPRSLRRSRAFRPGQPKTVTILRPGYSARTERNRVSKDIRLWA